MLALLAAAHMAAPLQQRCTEAHHVPCQVQHAKHNLHQIHSANRFKSSRHVVPSPHHTTPSPLLPYTPAGTLQGANQAVAAARLSSSAHSNGTRVRFVCRFGNDSYAAMLQSALTEAGVDVSGCVQVQGVGSGQGIVMLEPDGAASSIVVGGANTAWPEVSAFFTRQRMVLEVARLHRGLTAGLPSMHLRRSWQTATNRRA